MTDHLLSVTVILLAASLTTTLLLYRLKAPTLVGYILVGFMLGPSGFGVLHESPALDLLAEIGVAFLMFYVGLEFSLPALIDARRAVFGLGAAQVALTTGLGAAVALLAGLDLLPAALLGGAVAMSSTAISVRQLAEQRELTSRHGRLAVGTLLFQDLATLPFLVLVAALGAGAAAESGAAAEIWLELFRRLAVAAAAFALAVLIGRRLLVQAVAYVAGVGSREVFMLAILLIVLAAGLGAHEAGLSPPLGAFLAGMLLGETRFRHQVEEDVRPFRDVLLGLFFVSVGLQVEGSALVGAWPMVVSLLAAILVGKAVVVYVLARLFREPLGVAVRAAVILAHGGEFGLLMLTLALGEGVLAAGIGQPLLGATVLSMIVAPFLIGANGQIARATGAHPTGSPPP